MKRKTSHQPSTRVSVLAALIPVVAAVAVYLPSLRNGFIWDDPLVLEQLRALHSFGDLLVPPAIVPKFYFRPVIFLSYLVDRVLGGETPFWFHASVVAFHTLNTLLVFLLARRLFPTDLLIAAGGAALFAVFPTHVESVAWMAGRTDVIVCTFFLVTILLFMDRDRSRSAWLAGLALLFALLSKEMAVAAVVLLPVFDLLRDRRLHWRAYVPLGVATAIYFVLRTNALGAAVAGMETGLPATQLGLNVLRATGFYLIRTVIPTGLSPYIPEVPGSSLYLCAALIAAPLSVCLIVLAAQRGAWPAAFLGAWYFFTLAPSLTVIIRRSASAVVADRYLYVPTVGSCLLVAYALVRIAQSRRIDLRWAAIALTVVSGTLAAQAVPYSRVWADNLTFWSDVVAKVPDDAVPQRELATALMERGRLAEAEAALKRALAAKSDREGQAMTNSSLGNLYRRQGRFDEAAEAIDAGIKIAPHPALYHNLGMALMAKVEQEQHAGDQAAVRRDIAAARDAFEHALQLANTAGSAQTFHQQWDPAKTHALLGQVLFSLGDRSAARAHLETALRLEPTGPVAETTRQYMKKLPP